MLYVDARRPARRNREGEYVPLANQDVGLWSSEMISAAEALLFRASSLSSIGRYQLEAALQSAHVHRRRDGHINWSEVVQLYDALWALSGSPVVAINRALAVAEVQGPEVALHILQELSGDTRLTEYQPYWAARAELLTRTGACAEAAQAYELAIGLERDPAVRRFLQQRQEQIAQRRSPMSGGNSAL
jgi:RNA polymerase sigma-70 factor (ECF subfamily)